MKSVDPLFGKYNEDPFKSHDIHRPIDAHFTIHPKEHDSFFKQVVACRDAFYDDHWDSMNVIKRAVKFGVIGLALGGSLAISLRVIPSLALRKAQHFVNENTFGHAKNIWAMARPYGIIGAGVGVTHYFWFDKIWTKDSQFSPLTDHIVGNAIYGSAFVFLVINPRFWWTGLFAGGFLGAMLYNFKYSNLGPYRDSVGYYRELSGISEEEREKQKYRDQIEFLGQLPQVKFKRLIDIERS